MGNSSAAPSSQLASNTNSDNPLSASFLIPLFLFGLLVVYFVMTRRITHKEDAILGSTKSPEQILKEYQARAARDRS